MQWLNAPDSKKTEVYSLTLKPFRKIFLAGAGKQGSGSRLAFCRGTKTIETANATQATGPERKFGEEVRILQDLSITARQILCSLLALPAFLPASVCMGYLAAWFTNLHNFRQRSLVERLFWSVPLSLGISTITAVLIGKFVSLTAVVALFLASGVAWLAILFREWLQLRRAGRKWTIGWRPLGTATVILALAWVAVAILSLVDIQKGHQLFMSVATYDHASRVDWTESILRTGVPPANPLYWYKHAASMRYYYFWNVVCAAVAQMSHLPVRAVFIASCVWAGVALAAPLIGLYLKRHFLPPKAVCAVSFSLPFRCSW